VKFTDRSDWDLAHMIYLEGYNGFRYRRHNANGKFDPNAEGAERDSAVLLKVLSERRLQTGPNPSAPVPLGADSISHHGDHLNRSDGAWKEMPGTSPVVHG